MSITHTWRTREKWSSRGKFQLFERNWSESILSTLVFNSPTFHLRLVDEKTSTVSYGVHREPKIFRNIMNIRYIFDGTAYVGDSVLRRRILQWKWQNRKNYRSWKLPGIIKAVHFGLFTWLRLMWNSTHRSSSESFQIQGSSERTPRIVTYIRLGTLIVLVDATRSVWGCFRVFTHFDSCRATLRYTLLALTAEWISPMLMMIVILIATKLLTSSCSASFKITNLAIRKTENKVSAKSHSVLYR